MAIAICIPRYIFNMPCTFHPSGGIAEDWGSAFFQISTDPDEYDRLMGISSVDLSNEEDGFGDGELTDTHEQEDEVAINLSNPKYSRSGSGNCPGVAEDSMGVWECRSG